MDLSYTDSTLNHIDDMLLSGLAFGIFGKYTTRFGRQYPIIFGCAISIGAYLIAFLNLPSKSPLEDTADTAYINPSNQYLAIFGSFLLGLSDSSFITTIYSFIGSELKADSAAAFTIFQFTKSTTTSAAFFYSKEIELQYQLLILVIMCVFGTASFTIVELETQKTPLSFTNGYQDLTNKN